MSDRLEEILTRFHLDALNEQNLQPGFSKSLAEAKQALQSYIDTKIIEARIELVEELLKKYSNSTEFKSAYNDLYLIKEHLLDLDKLKALNHRKDKND